MEKFTKFILNIGSFYFLMIILYSFYNYDRWSFNKNYLCFSIIAILMIGLLSIIKRFNISTKLNLCLLIITSFISVYGTELVLVSLDYISRLDREDPRTREEVLIDLKKKNNIIAYPSFYPQLLIQTGLDSIIPLGGISNSTTILGNEEGFWSIFKSDKHGFNNNKFYDIPDIVLIGDSFGEGKSVKPEFTVQQNLSESGYNTISLSKAGNGPLTEFAVILEYVNIMKPKYVFWLFNQLDLYDLNTELNSQILTRYLYEKNFSNNLINIQDTIDSTWIKYYDTFKQVQNIPYYFVTLKKTRAMINEFISIQKYSHSNDKIKYNIFYNIIEKTNDNVRSFGGKLYFVILPTYSELGDDSFIYDKNKFKKSINKIIDGSILDLHNHFLYYEYGVNNLFNKTMSHYNKNGYELLSQQILNKIESQN